MQNNPYPSKFIVFEGLDGSGQTTQAEILGSFLSQQGYDVLNTKEPTKGSEVSKLIQTEKKIEPLELQQMFAKDRREHLNNLIIPALEQGKIVISDRYFFSSFSYGMASGLSLKEIYSLNNDFLIPNIVFFLDVGPKICLQRIIDRGQAITLFEKKDILEKVYENYKIVFREFKEKTIIHFINGKRPIKEVFEEIKSKI